MIDQLKIYFYQLLILSYCLALGRNDRVVDCDGLENRFSLGYRGFESLFLRQIWLLRIQIISNLI